MGVGRDRLGLEKLLKDSGECSDPNRDPGVVAGELTELAVELSSVHAEVMRARDALAAAGGATGEVSRRYADEAKHTAEAAMKAARGWVGPLASGMRVAADKAKTAAELAKADF